METGEFLAAGFMRCMISLLRIVYHVFPCSTTVSLECVSKIPEEAMQAYLGQAHPFSAAPLGFSRLIWRRILPPHFRQDLGSSDSLDDAPSDSS